ncbi:ATP-binding protein [Candidatus Enterococcus ikei]|uniref:ATP-binding protein n=1 Tax=Candidatus Enterococcus ikei TaxID=2815326 RepID=A0ABS3GVL8_9ENTE|nr:ATP-binding protein [Enterococcus sp. DIV0869a]MBO0438938.1 ATP-binding protein [Enterococcus sp. DIV0869a]
MNITSGKVPKAQKIVLYGVEGIGKSTFASQFPDPLFIDTEDSTLHMNVKRFDKPTSWTMLLQQVSYVKANKPCQTLVIDTMDWAEEICKRHLMDSNGWSAIDSEGYGKKFVALAKEMGSLLNLLSDVVDAGVNVVVTAHAMLRKKEEPDEMGAYDRYELKLEKKTAPIVKEWADAVLFANYKTTIITDSKTDSKKATGGQRMMYTTHRPAWDAKNRMGLADELPFDYSQIAQALMQVTIPKNSPVQPELDPKFDVASAAQSIPDENVPIPNVAPERDQVIPESVPKSVADLMVTNQVTVDEIMQIIYQGGFMPADTPLDNIPADLWGYLSSNWGKAMDLLNTKIRNF